MVKKSNRSEPDKDDETYQRWWDSIPMDVKVAVKRERALKHCLKFRYWLRNGNDHVGPEFIRKALKHSQQSLVSLRRYRDTGIWPTKH